MNTKKLTALLLAAMTAVTMGLTACGDSDSSGGSDGSSQSADAGKSAAEVADELKSGITFRDSLNELEPAMYEKVYGLTDDMYTSAKIYIGSGTIAEEIACIEAKDVDAVKNCINTRIENMKQSAKDYTPEEMDNLNNAVIVTKGSNVYMCISDDNAKAKEIIG